MATRTSLKDEELVSDPWAFMSPLASGLVIISVAALTEFKSIEHMSLMKHTDSNRSQFSIRGEARVQTRVLS